MIFDPCRSLFADSIPYITGQRGWCRRSVTKAHNSKNRMAKKNLWVGIPGNADDLIKLAEAIDVKNTALGDASPVKSVKAIANLGAKVAVGKTKNNLAKQLAKDAEKATQDRELALGQGGQLREETVRYWVTAVRDVLLGINKGNEQALGDWGFTVNTSAPAKKNPPTPPA